ncbi:MAG: L-histidine N(alpha)-methyltransferase [Cyanobacteria bacterium P01_A01_bin.40]
MCRDHRDLSEEHLNLINTNFKKLHGNYLNDVQRNILKRCYDDNLTYEELAQELDFTRPTINGYAAELWTLLSTLFKEDVSKTRLRGAVDRYIDSSPSETPRQNVKIFISDRTNNSNSDKVQQLQTAIQETGQETIIAENWLECSPEELAECIAFLAIVSSNSITESDILNQEIYKARKLRQNRPGKTLGIVLIHAESLLSLPLNHPLHQKLQGIPQLEWHSDTSLATLMAEIEHSLKYQQQQNRDALTDLIDNLLRLNISDNWMLTYVGENQLSQLGYLVRDLRNQRIQSGYAYWGVGPTLMWARACSDPTYHMSENLRQFPLYARNLARYVDHEQYNFVSLGVGEGSKDRNIIKDFFNRDENLKPRDDFLYIPVDMSLDMLRMAIGRIQELPSHRRIAIQRNIETQDGMRQIAHIAQILGEEKPILYGFIGNTIANVEVPEQVLGNIVQVMNTRDLLLFEAQIIDESALEGDWLEATIQSVREEYEGRSFRQFAFSALLQNSDLSIEPRERNLCYEVEVSLQTWQSSQILQIDCLFQNNTDRDIFLTFSDGDTMTLNFGDTISLYRSRKFTKAALENFIQAKNLTIVDTSTYLSYRNTGFMVMMLQRQTN